MCPIWKLFETETLLNKVSAQELLLTRLFQSRFNRLPKVSQGLKDLTYDWAIRHHSIRGTES